jgi:hypothetical protein
MAEQADTYTFEVDARVVTSDRPLTAIGEFHRALAQAAVEATIDGLEGYSVEGVRKDGVGFMRVTVPARVAEDGRWLWRRSVLYPDG